MDAFVSRVLLSVAFLCLIFRDGSIEVIISLCLASGLFSIAASIRNFGKPSMFEEIMKQTEKKEE